MNYAPTLLIWSFLKKEYMVYADDIMHLMIGSLHVILPRELVSTPAGVF